MRGESVIGSTRPERTLYFIEGYSSNYPSQSDVRLGISYAPGNIYTGICAVPEANSVLYGVPIDGTYGTYFASASDFWNADIENVGTPGSIAERLKNSSTIQITGAQIAALGG
jgi:hypothetical protein